MSINPYHFKDAFKHKRPGSRISEENREASASNRFDAPIKIKVMGNSIIKLNSKNMLSSQKGSQATLSAQKGPIKARLVIKRSDVKVRSEE